MPLRYGEEDAVAEVKARMEGYAVQAFNSITGLLHHRLTGTADGNFPFSSLHNGLRDYYIGSYFPFEIIKCISRMKDKPFVLEGIFRLCGYFWAAIRGIKREIPEDVIIHLRSEQKIKLFNLSKNLFRR